MYTLNIALCTAACVAGLGETYIVCLYTIYVRDNNSCHVASVSVRALSHGIYFRFLARDCLRVRDDEYRTVVN